MATPQEQIAALEIALKDCADDLEAEIEARYGSTKEHPAIRRKYERDIAPVRSARLLLRRNDPPPRSVEINKDRTANEWAW